MKWLAIAVASALSAVFRAQELDAGTTAAVSGLLASGVGSCWYGSLQPQVCCDLRKGPQGEVSCWNGPFTFEACCPAQAQFVKEELQKSCFIGGISAPACCDLRKGLQGDVACWDGDFTFDLCCPQEAAFVANAPEEACWTGSSPLAKSSCCDIRKGVQGDTSCWDDLFSFDLCCPVEKVEVAKAIEDSCWYGSLDPAFCCDTGKGPTGDDRCWYDLFNFASCCTPRTFAGIQRRAIEQTCWLGEITPEACCDMRKGSRGDPFCWSATHTFEACCPAEAQLAAQFREACWIGTPGMQDFCCDAAKGPEGDEACWSGVYSFNNCCP